MKNRYVETNGVRIHYLDHHSGSGPTLVLAPGLSANAHSFDGLVKAVLGVSHGSVYRHFPSKAALRDAVTERWLVAISSPLEAVANEEGDAPERLRRWLDLLVDSKRSKALGDPELFATYVELTADARDVVKAHVGTLVGQLQRIIDDGVASGKFETADSLVTARAVFDATARFHNPVHAPEWTDPGIDSDYECVRALALRGLERKRPRRG